MKIERADKKSSHIKLALQGPAGSGKTFSALKLARGLTSWENIVVIDTENGSSHLYADLGGYKVLRLEAPYTPERYIEALELCKGAEVVIIDSITHEWDGSGGILETHGGMVGNSFTNWSKLTPRHNKFVGAIVNAPQHVICTIRTKQDYVLNQKNGKYVPEKVGLKGVTRDGMDYEFTLVFDLDIAHHAVASKDRTGLFVDRPEFKISEGTGKRLKEWCYTPEPPKPDLLAIRISKADEQELKSIMYQYKLSTKTKYGILVARRRNELKKINSNGSH